MAHTSQEDTSRSRRIRIVAIGGGTGLPILLRGLKRYTDKIELAAIVTTFDDGGSSGRLRQEFGVPALGDLRRCVTALLPDYVDESSIGRMLEHRFSSTGTLNGHTLGNLILLAMTQRLGGLAEASEAARIAFGSLERAIPVSSEPSSLCAKLEDGTILRGESVIDTRNQLGIGVARVYLDPPVEVNTDAFGELLDADIVILGPGDLYTSVIANLLPDGVLTALRVSKCKILQICNIANKVGETSGYKTSDFARVANHYLESDDSVLSPGRCVDAMIVNESTNRMIEFADPVELDDELHDLVKTVLVRPVAHSEIPRIHDPDKLASAVMEYIDATIGSR